MSDFQINPPIEEKRVIPWIFQPNHSFYFVSEENKKTEKEKIELVQKYYAGIGIKNLKSG